MLLLPDISCLLLFRCSIRDIVDWSRRVTATPPCNAYGMHNFRLRQDLRKKHFQGVRRLIPALQTLSSPFDLSRLEINCFPYYMDADFQVKARE